MKGNTHMHHLTYIRSRALALVFTAAYYILVIIVDS